jgi:PPM family protein phosphatase
MPLGPLLEVGSRSDPGRKRQGNQDRVFVDPPSHPSIAETRGSLFAVADGMGGHQAGELAADCAITKVKEEYYFGDQSLDVSGALRRAIIAANTAVYDLGRSHPSRSGMGTTFVAAVVHGDRAVFAHVGDSRAYVASADKIRRITTDHSLVQALVERGEIAPGEAQDHPQRHVITRSLGIQSTVELDAFDLALQPDETIVLCSDGLSGQVSDEEIWSNVTRMSPQRAADELVRLANERGGPDNIGIVVVGPRRPYRMRNGHSFWWLLGELTAVLFLAAIVGAYAYTRQSAVAIAPTTPTVAAREVVGAASAPIVVSDRMTREHTPPTPFLSLIPTVAVVATMPAVDATPISDRAVAATRPGNACPTATLLPAATKPAVRAGTATHRPVVTARAGVSGGGSGRTAGAVATVTSPASPYAKSTTPTPMAGTALTLNPALNTGGSVQLSWNYAGTLTDDASFDVRVWGSGVGDPNAGIANVASSERTYLVGAGFIYGPGTYFWTIALIRSHGGVVETVAEASGPLQFTWAPPADPSSGRPVRPP